jgi:hypothetical protein
MNNKWSIWKLGVMVVAVVIMSGCVSFEEQRRSMVNYCYKLGFKYDSPKFSDCIAQLEQQIGLSQQCAGAFRYGVPNTYGTCMSQRLR